MYYFEIAKIMHQYSIKHLPICFISFFTQTSSIHNRSITSNNRNDLYLPHFLSSRCQRSIKIQGAKIWNSISPHIRNQSFNTFKRKGAFTAVYSTFFFQRDLGLFYWRSNPLIFSRKHEWIWASIKQTKITLKEKSIVNGCKRALISKFSS